MTTWDDLGADDGFFGRRPTPASGPRPGGATTTIIGTRPGARAGAGAPAGASDRRALRRVASPGLGGTRRASPAPSDRRRRARPGSEVRSGPSSPGRGRRPRLDHEAMRRRSMRRLTAFLVAISLLSTGVVVRLVDISRNGGSSCRTVGVIDCRSYGLDQRSAFRPIRAGRGAIKDRNGQAFALSISRPNVVADPENITEPGRTARILAPILEVDPATLAAAFSEKGSRYALLAPTVGDDVVAELKQAITEADLVGISFEDQFVREYPSDGLARAVVGETYDRGMVDEEGRQGQTGIEQSWDTRLKGADGRLGFEKDRAGGTIAGTREKIDPSVPGTDLYLSLDQSLQFAAERAMADQVEATGAQQGMAVISRPSTGEVLAMVSVADDGTGTVASTGDNRPVSTVFEPGSVNKMITVAGAIEDGVVQPDTMLDVPDELQVADHRFTDHDSHAVEPWSVTDILVTSSNIGTIKVAQKLGPDRVDHYLRSFGFGQPTGTDFPGEVRGLMLDREDWSGTSIGAIPIGQGISVTALQMLAAYNVVANDGVAVAPKLVVATDEGSGRVPTDASAQRRVLSEDTARAMTTMLTKVVSDGTGRSAQVPGYPAAGKTGTARIPQPAPHKDPADAYQDAEGDYHYMSSFVGFVAGADLSIMVTVQDAQSSIYGSAVAAPVFSRLASFALRSESIPPPALVDPGSHAVPALSPSARDIDGEDPASMAPSTQG